LPEGGFSTAPTSQISPCPFDSSRKMSPADSDIGPPRAFPHVVCQGPPIWPQPVGRFSPVMPKFDVARPTPGPSCPHRTVIAPRLEGRRIARHGERSGGPGRGCKCCNRTTTFRNPRLHRILDESPQFFSPHDSLPCSQAEARTGPLLQNIGRPGLGRPPRSPPWVPGFWASGRRAPRKRGSRAARRASRWAAFRVPSRSITRRQKKAPLLHPSRPFFPSRSPSGARGSTNQKSGRRLRVKFNRPVLGTAAFCLAGQRPKSPS